MAVIKPILFSKPMVRALREDAKTQTRRLLKPQPDPRTTDCTVCRNKWMGEGSATGGSGTAQWDPWRDLKFMIGDVLWVREEWRTDVSFDHLSPKQIEERCIIAGHKRGWAPIAYDAGGYSPSWGSNGWHELGRRRASMHMPRWASRITLELTGVKVERLQDISEADVKAEGIEYATRPFGDWRLIPGIWDLAGVDQTGLQREPPAAIKYAYLWNTINKAEGDRWADNPWVVAPTFKVHRVNVDAFLAQRERAAA